MSLEISERPKESFMPVALAAVKFMHGSTTPARRSGVDEGVK
jgi:hypothetical protein